MKKSHRVILGIMLIAAGIIINLLLKDSNTNMDRELIGFFSGLLIGGGIGISLSAFIKKKNEN